MLFFYFSNRRSKRERLEKNFDNLTWCHMISKKWRFLVILIKTLKIKAWTHVHSFLKSNSFKWTNERYINKVYLLSYSILSRYTLECRSVKGRVLCIRFVLYYFYWYYSCVYSFTQDNQKQIWKVDRLVVEA